MAEPLMEKSFETQLESVERFGEVWKREWQIDVWRGFETGFSAWFGLNKLEKPGWRNGRRGGLKIRYPQGCVGSSPSPGTSYRPDDDSRPEGYNYGHDRANFSVAATGQPASTPPCGPTTP